MEQEADFGEPNVVVDLIQNGGEVAVTAENRRKYVAAYVQHLLTKSVKRQSQAFCRGFKKVGQLRTFQELQNGPPALQFDFAARVGSCSVGLLMHQ